MPRQLHRHALRYFGGERLRLVDLAAGCCMAVGAWAMTSGDDRSMTAKSIDVGVAVAAATDNKEHGGKHKGH